MSKPLLLAIDFDGVLHDPNNVPPGQRMGQPMPGAVEALRALKAAGNKVVVFTVRGNTPRGIQAVKEWLQYFSVPYDDVTALKPNADVYVDDKALHFDSWKQVMECLSSN